MYTCPFQPKLQNERIQDPKSVRFITGFNDKYTAIFSILHKQWIVLQLYHKLNLVFLTAPTITFRQARTLKNILVPSKLTLQRKRNTMDIHIFFDNRTGTFKYHARGCLTCQLICHGCTNIIDSKGNRDQIRQFIICAFEFVIYILRCSCNLCMQAVQKRLNTQVNTTG